jgi:hypothetical protein
MSDVKCPSCNYHNHINTITRKISFPKLPDHEIKINAYKSKNSTSLLTKLLQNEDKKKEKEKIYIYNKIYFHALA